MKRRVTKKPSAKRAATPKPASRSASNGDPLADPRLRPLVARYCRLARVKHNGKHADLLELALPTAERRFFRERASLAVAFSLDALERDPEAEIAVLGSPFVLQLLEAIRGRGTRRSLGLIATATPLTGKRARVELSLPVRGGQASHAKTHSAVRPVGRLTARIVLRAGAGVEEAVVESDVYDLAAGAPVSRDVADRFHDLEAGRIEPAEADLLEKMKPVVSLAPDALLRLLMSNLRDKSAERVAARRAKAEAVLALELARLDRYFATILADQSDEAGIAAVTALADRRRTEEVRRNQVRATVHPLQLVEAAVLIERAEWQLMGPHDHTASFGAQRATSGAGEWIFACPQCGTPPTTLVVCKHDHCGCEACTERCSVCAEDFCGEHGIAQCRVDGAPACAEHARTCSSCQLQHCTAHEVVCSEGQHAVCASCIGSCASCGRAICNRHAEQSSADAPHGSRRLCGTCIRHCEGGSNELVGVDEVRTCASCGEAVCTAHQAVCAVDGKVYCSRHVRRADGSRRLVCSTHWAACTFEEDVLFASDEVAACASCGKPVCANHSAECAVDGLRHCTIHLAVLADADSAYLCEAHRDRGDLSGKVRNDGLS